MRLGTKHQNQFQIVHADFSGGLNTSTSVDGIAENQLSRATNVEVDHATGQLRTVAGTVDVLKLENIFAAMYDDINRKLLVVKEDKKIYAFDLETHKLGKALGTLSGEIYPIATSWEDGILIASGGKLQYFNGKNLLTIENSPVSNCVCIQAGRVLVTDEHNLYLSGVGDETNWIENANVDSSAKFLEVGYKDGGKLIGMIGLPSGVLLLKNNRRIYRLNIGFPTWSLVEISRETEVGGRLSICAVADFAFVLGRDEVQNIQAANIYGNAKPQNIGLLIRREVSNLPENTLLRFVPSLNQVWAISNSVVLIYDLVTQSWYNRQFNSQVLDVLSAEEEIFIVKPDRISKLDEKTFCDSGEPLTWNFQCKRRISHQNYFLKRTSISFTPLNKNLYKGQVRVGAVIVNLPTRDEKTSSGRRFAFSKGEAIYKNYEPIYGNTQSIYNRPTIIAENRNVYRSKFLDVTWRGSVGGIIFNSITLDLVEV